MNDLPRIILPAEPGGREWLLLRHPVCVLSAASVAEVDACIREVERRVAAGLTAAGFLTYEAAPAFDCAFRVRESTGLPLAWFGLFDRAEPFAGPVAGGEAILRGMGEAEASPHAGVGTEHAGRPEWTPNLSREAYDASLRKIRDYLVQGDTYQVNFTLRLRAAFRADPLGLFLRLQRAQNAAYAVYLETENFALCSASPELFFRLDGERLESRPMKGTSRRGMTTAEDRALAAALMHSEKERAENVMIVDMVRNDMGRIAAPGTVEVERLFDVERYPTVWQLTSTVACRTGASIRDLFGALFPCASITGAPKVRAMEIIRELEAAPRGIYTGCVGCLAPGRKAWFNVAIRTVAVDKRSGGAEYGVGGGIVWDSVAGAEYRECLAKASVLTADFPEFELLETLLWAGEAGYFLPDRHLARLVDSADYFGVPVDMEEVRRRLLAAGEALGGRAGRVRLLVSGDGAPRVESTARPPAAPKGPWRLVLAREPIDPENPFIYHKTTHHPVRGRCAAEVGVPAPAGGAPDDVLLWNPRGEVTESSIANIVIERDGRRVTPPVVCGLLAGVFRAWLLDNGEIEEGVVTIDDVRAADRIFLINSVRKWVPAIIL